MIRRQKEFASLTTHSNILKESRFGGAATESVEIALLNVDDDFSVEGSTRKLIS